MPITNDNTYLTFYNTSKLMRVDKHLIHLKSPSSTMEQMFPFAINAISVTLYCEVSNKDDNKKFISGQISSNHDPHIYDFGFFFPFSAIQMKSGALLIVGVRRIQRLFKAQRKLRQDKAFAAAMASHPRLGDLSTSSSSCALAKYPSDIMKNILEMVLLLSHQK